MNLPTPSPAQLRAMAEDLVALAQQAGLVLTVEQVSQMPFAMGNYTTVVRVRPAREKAPISARDNPDLKDDAQTLSNVEIDAITRRIFGTTKGVAITPMRDYARAVLAAANGKNDGNTRNGVPTP